MNQYARRYLQDWGLIRFIFGCPCASHGFYIPDKDDRGESPTLLQHLTLRPKYTNSSRCLAPLTSLNTCRGSVIICVPLWISMCLWTYIFNLGGVNSVIKSKHGPPWVFVSSHKDFSFGRVFYIWVFISSQCLKY